MGSRNRTAALVVAAGSGSRAGAGLPKQYALLAGKPLLAHAIDRLRHELIDEVRVVIGPGQEELYRAAVGDRPLPSPVLGGETRRQSVRNGLEAIAAEGGADAVLIHDAARPLLPGAVVERLTDALRRADGAVPVLSVADSLARSGDFLGDPVPRENIVRVQTPQAFGFDVILAAHRAWDGRCGADGRCAGGPRGAARRCYGRGRPDA
jgi:2-C-methyl-D-erythritol 4-phosphate cytidylyltransferase/2-C-methyl-D-erythritol 2,4-cyclodiphosphate synthase